MIRIIVDSSTLYTVEQGKAMGIDVVPLSVTINNQSYREFEDINAREFVALVNQGHVPSSSQPPVGEYLELFEKYINDPIIVITMADGLSGTYQSCVGAMNLSNHPNITVINSKTLSLTHRKIVDDAVALRDGGASYDEIVNIINQQIETSKSFLLPQDFEFLKRGGRLTALAAKLSGFLKIQPVVAQNEDGTRLESFGIGRNFNLAVKKVLNHLEEKGIDQHYFFCISHAFVAEQAQAVADRIKEQFNTAHVQIEELSCAFITQGGPKCLAIQVIKQASL